MVGIVNNEMEYTPLENAIREKQSISPDWMQIVKILNMHKTNNFYFKTLINVTCRKILIYITTMDKQAGIEHTSTAQKL